MTAHAGVIVVGVDHTRAARAALEFALDEGLAHGSAVEVVTAWLWTSPFEGMNHVTSLAEGRAVAEAAQDAVIRGILDARAARPVVSRTVVHGNAGRALVERCEGARMLVVGSSRKGTLSRALLGSVSAFCLRHAVAPVVVVADPGRVEHPPPGELPMVREGDGHRRE